jgi:hypothetical protein
MWPTIIPIIGNLLDKIFPNAKDAAEAKLKVMEMAQSGELAALDADLKMAQGQMEINKAEAASGNLYASSWRPTIGYICAIGLFYNFLGYPLLTWIAAVWSPAMTVPPLLDNNLFELVLGMLGLAGFRTYEKVKGINK